MVLFGENFTEISSKVPCLLDESVLTPTDEGGQHESTGQTKQEPESQGRSVASFERDDFLQDVYGENGTAHGALVVIYVAAGKRAVLNGALVVQSAPEGAALNGAFVGYCDGDDTAGAFQGAVVLNGA